MNKLSFITVCLAIITLGIALRTSQTLLGGVGADPGFSGATNTTVTCTGGASTSTLVQATTTGRTSFAFSNNNFSGTVYLCRFPTCAVNTGLILTSSSPRFEQTDSYIGPYSCFSTGTSTASLWSSGG